MSSSPSLSMSSTLAANAGSWSSSLEIVSRYEAATPSSRVVVAGSSLTAVAACSVGTTATGAGGTSTRVPDPAPSPAGVVVPAARVEAVGALAVSVAAVVAGALSMLGEIAHVILLMVTVMPPVWRALAEGIRTDHNHRGLARDPDRPPARLQPVTPAAPESHLMHMGAGPDRAAQATLRATMNRKPFDSSLLLT